MNTHVLHLHLSAEVVLWFRTLPIKTFTPVERVFSTAALKASSDPGPRPAQNVWKVMKGWRPFMEHFHHWDVAVMTKPCAATHP